MSDVVKELINDLRSNKRSILLVEDDQFDRELAMRAFEPVRNKFLIDTAFDREQAIQHLVREDYDIVFLDMKLPVKDGVAVLNYCKENCPKTPIIVVTAYRNSYYFERAPIMSFKQIIDKPLTKEIVIEILQKLNLLN